VLSTINLINMIQLLVDLM